MEHPGLQPVLREPSATSIGARSKRRLKTGLSRAAGLGLLTIALCEAVGELIEHTVMAQAPMPMIHLLHTARGVTSSVLTAAVVGWSLLASSPPLLTPASMRSSDLTLRSNDADRTAHYSRWLIQMRWVVIVAATAMAVLTVKVVPLLSPRVWAPMIGTIALLAATNVFYEVQASRRPFRGLLQIQLVADLIVLTTFLHLTGGVENPLSVAALFHVVFAGILLPRRQCYTLAALAALLFTAMAGAEWSGVLQHHSLATVLHAREGGLYVARDPLSVATHAGVQTAALFLIAYFATTLAERTRRDERKLEALADRALAERQLLERALDTTGMGLRVSDTDMRVAWVNKRWREWFENDSPSADAPRRTLQDQAIRVDEVLHETPGESGESAFQVTTAPVLDLDGNVVQVAELAMDVTRQKLAQAQMIRAGKMAAVGELAGQVAHEVNNPIAVISGKARLMLSGRRDEMSPAVAMEIDKIVVLADRVADIARGLLSYCRPSPGIHRRLDFRQPARHALSMIAERARHSGVEVDDRLPDVPLMVHANAGELEQVFLNLFLNALDAMPDGGRLTLSRAPPGSQLPDARETIGLDIEDTGVGIPDGILDKIWEPFFTTKGEHKGTGLGLCICHGLVESQGGLMRVDSEPGRGTTFSVLLPPCADSEPPAAP